MARPTPSTTVSRKAAEQIILEGAGCVPGMGTDASADKLFDIVSAEVYNRYPIRDALDNWLIASGIPAASGTSSLLRSRCLAWAKPAYLRSWRTKVNPSWDLLHDDDVADDTDIANVADISPNATPSAASPDSPANHQWQSQLHSEMAKALDKQLAERLTADVPKAIASAIANATLRLDDGAKAQIRALAISAAQDKITELMPPREILVTNADAGTSINIGLQHKNFPTLLRAAGAKDHRGFRLNIWLTGPTGSGKTTAAENVAKALSLPFGSDGSLDADYKVLGFRDANGNIISTQFLDIYAKGGIYVADEIDNWMPSALLSLNAALANGWASSPSGLIKRHPDACIIACANTWGLGATSDYVGRTKLDAASLDRFQPKINWPYDEELEKAIAIAHGGTSIGDRWFQIVRQARANVAIQGLKIIVSPRATINGIALLKAGFDLSEVVDQTLAAGISPEQKKAIGLDAIGKQPSAPAQAPFRPTSENASDIAKQRLAELTRNRRFGT